MIILKFMNKLSLFLFGFFISCNYVLAQSNLDFLIPDSIGLDSDVPINMQSELIDGVFAVVGGHVIFHSDISNQIFQYQTQGSNYQDISILREKVIKELVFQKLLLYSANLDSLDIDNSEIDNNINQRITFFEQQFGSQEAIEQYFQKTMTELISELKPMIHDQLLMQKMKYEITKNINVSPLEVSTFYHSLDPDSIPIIDAQFQIAHILKIPDAADVAIEETLSKLEDLRNRILNGADFATMAILYSEDPGSSRNGGAYFKVKKDFFVKEFEAVAFSLHPGDISEIFKTEFGYHIIELIDRRGNELDLRHILMTPKISNKDMVQAKEFLQSLRSDIIDNQINFSDAARESSSDKETRYNGGLLINPNTNNSFFSILDLEKDPALLNEIKLKAIGDITNPVYIKLLNGKEAYRIIKLVDKKEKHVASIKDDYAFLQNYYHQIKEQNMINDWYVEILQDVHIDIVDNIYNYNFFNNVLNNE